MSSIVIIHIEGVMTDPGDTDQLPIANPSATGLRFVQALAEVWPIGYITNVDREKAAAWLADVSAPAGAWIAQATDDSRGEVILSMLAQRTDRAQLYVTTSVHGITQLLKNHVPVLRYYPARGALGDWRAPSAWTDSEPIVEAGE